MLNVLRDLQRRLGVSSLFIAHDLAAVAHMSHAMYQGKIVELGAAAEVAVRPKHPYTQALFSAALPLDPGERREEIILSGEIPSPLDPPPGCRFHTRCPQVMERCRRDEPRLAPESGRLVACHLYPVSTTTGG
jgi:oligopeptide/dipeptide ABC transporter ATP-binding protein